MGRILFEVYETSETLTLHFVDDSPSFQLENEKEKGKICGHLYVQSGAWRVG